jgi:hypothetical protein
MTSPVFVFGVAGGTKTTGTSLGITYPSRTWAVGDILVVLLAMDPAAGAVGFGGASSGVPPANFGAWSANVDIAQGSGTSGVRSVAAWCMCTTAFTGSFSANAYHPSATARALLTGAVTGCDGTTPVRGSNTGSSSTFLSVAATAAAGAAFDAVAVLLGGFEQPNAASMTYGTPSGWVVQTVAASATGTTGAANASNISVAYAAYTKSGVAGSEQVTLAVTSPSVNSAGAALIFQNPAAGGGTDPQPQPAAAVASAAAPAPAVATLETSPALEISGFTLTGPGASDTILGVNASVHAYVSDPAMTPFRYELWDGSTALISSATGTASTSTSNYDQFTFPAAPSYAQLAALRLRIYAADGTAVSGPVASVDYASLSVSYIPVPPGLVNAGLASAAGGAPQPSVTVVPSTSAPAGLAAAAATAPVPLASITFTAGLATTAAAALAPAAAAGANAGLAAAAAASPQPSRAVSVTAGLATAAAAALTPAVTETDI